MKGSIRIQETKGQIKTRRDVGTRHSRLLSGVGFTVLLMLVVFLAGCQLIRREERRETATPTAAAGVTETAPPIVSPTLTEVIPGTQTSTSSPPPTVSGPTVPPTPPAPSTSVPATAVPITSSSAKALGAGVQPEALPVACNLLQEYGSRYQWFTTNWQEIEPARGRWDFARVDRWVDGYRTCGQEVATHINANATWAIQPAPAGAPQVNHTIDMPPKNMQDYYDFVFNLAAHYKGRITRYSIENEAHAEQNWGGTPQDYIQLLQTAYKAIKAADPNAIVEDAGLSHEAFGVLAAYDMYKSGRQQQAKDYLTEYLAHKGTVPAQTLIQALDTNPNQVQSDRIFVWFDLLLQNAAYYDRLQVHYYAPWQDLPALTDFIHRKMAAAGVNKQLDFFEMGYGWNGAPGNGYDPQAHARDLVKLLTIALGEGADRLVQYRATCATDSIGQPGLFDCSGKPRPAAASFKTTSEKLTGTTGATRLSLGSNIWGYQFIKGNKMIYVVWTDATNTTAQLPFSGGATVTDIFGNATQVQSNAVPVSVSPVFVEP